MRLSLSGLALENDWIRRLALRGELVAARIVPRLCQKERARTVTNGRIMGCAGHGDVDSACYQSCQNKPDPKIGELVGARQRPAELQRSRAGLAQRVRPPVLG